MYSWDRDYRVYDESQCINCQLLVERLAIRSELIIRKHYLYTKLRNFVELLNCQDEPNMNRYAVPNSRKKIRSHHPPIICDMEVSGVERTTLLTSIDFVGSHVRSGGTSGIVIKFLTLENKKLSTSRLSSTRPWTEKSKHVNSKCGTGVWQR